MVTMKKTNDVCSLATVVGYISFHELSKWNHNVCQFPVFGFLTFVLTVHLQLLWDDRNNYHAGQAVMLSFLSRY